MNSDYEEVMARVPRLTPVESAAQASETVERMLAILARRGDSRFLHEASALRRVLTQFERLPAHPTNDDVERLISEFLRLLADRPMLQSLKGVVENEPLIETVEQHVAELEARATDGSITDDERLNLPQLRQALDALKETVSQFRAEFDREIGER